MQLYTKAELISRIKRDIVLTLLIGYKLYTSFSVSSQAELGMFLTHKGERDQDVHTAAAGHGHDSEWLESHLRRLQSSSVTT